MADINSLPDEVLIRIFEYYRITETQQNLLNYLSKVCKRWEKVSKDSSNFQSVDGSISTGTIISLAKAGCLKKTKSLKFGIIHKSKHKSVFDTRFKNFYANLPRLKRLNLGNVCSDFDKKKEHSIFTELKDFCPDLCELVLCDANINCKTIISNSIFEEFLRVRGPKLVTLDFSRTDIPGIKKVIMGIAKNCPNLEDLIIQDMTVSARGNDTNYMFPIEEMQVGCPKLKTLRLSSPFIFSRKINPESPGFPQLETFTYPYRDELHFRDDFFLMLLDKSPNLQILDIRGSQKVSIEAVHSLGATNLEQLYLSHTNISKQTGMVMLLQKWCHSLRAIDLSHTTINFFNEMLGPLTMPLGLPELESLDVNSSSILIHTLKHIIQHSPKLTFLNLQLCRSLGRKMRHIYHSRAEIEDLLKQEEIDLT